MQIETITEHDTLVIRRMILDPGESMFWHTDNCRRFTVVVSGSGLLIEYRDSGEKIAVEVHPGLADWNDPDDRLHRATNTGSGCYEEVVTFFRANAGVEPQPAG